jgi:UDP-2-acetamido-3-amino-2,3-dideoxy-glucuronate N-acetyltransferase
MRTALERLPCAEEGPGSFFFAHPTAQIHTSHIGSTTTIWTAVRIGVGAIVGAGCSLAPWVRLAEGVRLGDRVSVGAGVFVPAGTVIEDDVLLGRGVKFIESRRRRTRTLLERAAVIGDYSSILRGIDIGAYAFIQSRSVVRENIPGHGYVGGAPGRRRGWVCICRKLLDAQTGGGLLCPSCGRRYRSGHRRIRLLEHSPPAGR